MSARSLRVARTTRRKTARASSVELCWLPGTRVADRPMLIESPPQRRSMVPLTCVPDKNKRGTIHRILHPVEKGQVGDCGRFPRAAQGMVMTNVIPFVARADSH